MTIPARISDQATLGWKLVPIEPTPEMIDAWASARADVPKESSDEESNALVCASDWSAMLAAAPLTTPSPISDQAALLHRLNDATKPVDAADRNLIIRALSAALTTGSAPVAYMHRNAGPWDLSFADDEGKLREVHTKAIPLYDMPPDSPAASIMQRSVDAWDKYWSGGRAESDAVEFVKAISAQRALLAASMGGDKS